MLSFVLKDGDDAALALVHALELAIEAPSLGGVETLVGLPRFMSHAHISPEERLAYGIPPGMVRVSVGIEDPIDLIADFEQALASIVQGQEPARTGS
jgi:cystathionine beta-lyase/cystathionine gamma-synthase